ncbi:hypothetical protein H109_05523 [Trichophyton interdigitale MR816]|uniref:Pisatin demethylase n=1 Tax=Trichophyton interdigitale (strain MR816) TaxID=1215338 RepID=A0A059J510_TRIIM|nr:hypothetical protein H101_02515 [Trichophyton interdigitale H6]KDB22567.1 hypothetical protein H109_05523 [Trichophyton interdigitale MR816]
MASNLTTSILQHTIVLDYAQAVLETDQWLRAAKSHISTHPSAVSLAIISGIVIYAIRSSTARYLRLSAFHGPPWAAFTRLWLCKTIASGESATRFINANQQYGPVARIGPNHLLTDDPEFIRKILAARSHYTRGPWFDSIRIDPEVPNIVSERHPGRHNHLRHQMSGAYAGRDVEGLEDMIDERIQDFVEVIERKWLSDDNGTNVFDIAQRVQFLAVDMITHICFGKPMGFVKTDSDVSDFLKTIESQLPIVQHFSVIIEINDLLHWLVGLPFMRRLIVPSSQDKSGIGIIMGITRNEVEKRQQSKSEPKKDMLTSFMKHGLSPSEAETELIISLVAGSDTTATAIRATLLAVASNPRVYARLTKEIDEAEATGKISSPIRDQEARRLPYLQACIKEGLRCFPPVAQLRERMVPAGGDTYNGQHIPEGTFIGLNTWGVQLNPVFGNDPRVFRPERWLIEDETRLQEMSRVQELIFGHGTTRCLGIPIAMMNLNKVFPELLRRFDISIVNTTKPWTSICYGIFFQTEMNVRVSRRR